MCKDKEESLFYLLFFGGGGGGGEYYEIRYLGLKSDKSIYGKKVKVVS